jgi:peptidoglycan/LPS O-acetylase OafA/YrhL
MGLSYVALLFYCFYFATNEDIDENFRVSTIRAASAFLIGILLFLGRGVISAVSERCLTFIQFAATIALLLTLHFGLADVLSIGLMALIVLVTWEDRGSLCDWLATRPMHTIGLFSFSIYMWHYLIKFIGQRDWEYYTGLPVQSSVMGSVIFVISLMIVVIPISVWSYRFLEMPARKWTILKLSGLLEAKHTPKYA